MAVNASGGLWRFVRLAFWSTLGSAFFTSALMVFVAAVVEVRGEDIKPWEAVVTLPFQMIGLFMPAVSVAVMAWPYTLTCAAVAFLLARFAGSGRLVPHNADRLAAVFAGAVSAAAFCLLPVIGAMRAAAEPWGSEVLGAASMSFMIIFPFVFPSVMLATILTAWAVYKPETLGGGPLG